MDQGLLQNGQGSEAVVTAGMGGDAPTAGSDIPMDHFDAHGPEYGLWTLVSRRPRPKSRIGNKNSHHSQFNEYEKGMGPRAIMGRVLVWPNL